MKNLFIITLALSLNSLAFTGELDRLAEKAEEAARKNGKKISDGVETLKDRNERELNDIEREAKRAEANVNKEFKRVNEDVNELYKKLEGDLNANSDEFNNWLKQVAQDVEADYKEFRANRKDDEIKKAEPSKLSEEDKKAAGQLVYAKLNLVDWFHGENPQSKDFISHLDANLTQSTLTIDDIAYVRNEHGNTLLHTLVEIAYILDQQVESDELTTARARVALNLIAFFGSETLLGGVKNNVDKTPIDLLLDKDPPSLLLVDFILKHDKDGLSKVAYTARLKK